MKTKTVLAGGFIVGGVAGIGYYLFMRGEPGPKCTEGQTKCVNYNKYICIDGDWFLEEVDSIDCGWTPGRMSAQTLWDGVELPTFYGGSSHQISCEVTNYTDDTISIEMLMFTSFGFQLPGSLSDAGGDYIALDPHSTLLVEPGCCGLPVAGGFIEMKTGTGTYNVEVRVREENNVLTTLIGGQVIII